MTTEHPEPDGPLDDGLDGRPGSGVPVRWHGLIKMLTAVRVGVSRVLALICIVTFVALVVIVSWQVFTREVINNSAPWTEEAARYMFVVLAIFAGAYVFSERGHIAVEILVEKLSERFQRAMGVLIELIVIFFAALVFIYGGSRVVENAWTQEIATLPLSVGQVFLVLPIAGILIVFYSLTHLIGILSGVEKPIPDFDESQEAV